MDCSADRSGQSIWGHMATHEAKKVDLGRSLTDMWRGGRRATASPPLRRFRHGGFAHARRRRLPLWLRSSLSCAYGGGVFVPRRFAHTGLC
eukprot:361200-Chlamydomonas_euryale.AAC.13